MSSDEKLLKIASKLYERSMSGDISWSETADLNKFSAAFPDYSVTIAHYDSQVDFLMGTYIFSVYNEKGTEIESVQGDYGLRDSEEGTFRTSADMLAPLYQAARRQALKSDEILDDLLTRLSGDG